MHASLPKLNGPALSFCGPDGSRISYHGPGLECGTQLDYLPGFENRRTLEPISMSSPDPNLLHEGLAELVMHRKKKQSERKSGRVAADDDGQLFRRAMAGAKPLRTDTIEPPQRRPRAAARFSRLDEREVLRESLEAAPHAIEIANGSALYYRHPSVTLKAMRRLARGSVSVQAEVDLHGLNSADAKQALKEFIEHSLLRGHTCVRVVHGKGLGSGHGGPVLKRKVDQWLRRWEPVLAFVSARQVDGGTGAAYVLLKKLN